MSDSKVLCAVCVSLVSLVLFSTTSCKKAEEPEGQGGGKAPRQRVLPLRQGGMRADAHMLTDEGAKLSKKEAAELEDEVEANPDDLSSRTKLLGYYFLKAHKSASSRKKRQEHAMWVIENRPEADIAGLPYAELDPILDGQAYDKAKDLWLKQVELNSDNATVLGNAANLFFIHDRDIAEELLKKAQDLEPDSPEWPRRLALLYSLSALTAAYGASAEDTELAAESLAELERALARTRREVEKFYLLSDLATAAFEAGDQDKARKYATELLGEAGRYRRDWNYGNAIHKGNLVLGRVALKSGDLDRAKEHLIKAGKTPGSPQLDSFGPNMTLAKELLEQGEREVVIEYFDLCGAFWEMREDRLKTWASIVEGGGIPDFGANLDY